MDFLEDLLPWSDKLPEEYHKEIYIQPTELRNLEPRSLFWQGTYDCAFTKNMNSQKGYQAVIKTVFSQI